MPVHKQEINYVDAHHHFWDPARGDYHWMSPEVDVLFRPYGPGQLKPLMERHAIQRSLLVQAACTDAETDWLLAHAAAAQWVAGVVAWVNFTSACAPARIAELAATGMVVGLRPMVQDIADDDWLIRADLAPAVFALAEHRLVFDALTFPRHLPRLCAFRDRFPDPVMVLDHGSKPFIAAGTLDPWRADVAAFAARPRTYVKLSGLVTEAAPNWTVDDLRPYVDHLLDCFGPDRMMWGSDWPVVEVAGGYDRWREATEILLEDLSDQERAAIYGGTAAQVYLEGRTQS